MNKMVNAYLSQNDHAIKEEIMKLLKKNQIVIYVIALMLMAVAYLNYTTNTAEQSVQASMQMEARDDSNTANIGDATLVSSNSVVEETNTIEQRILTSLHLIGINCIMKQ